MESRHPHTSRRPVRTLGHEDDFQRALNDPPPEEHKLADDWDPALYRRFEDERTRPARDLLARVFLDRPALVVDLGCGPGNSTELLVARFPSAEVMGIDASPAMLEAARARLPFLEFRHADAAMWVPDRPVDLIFANAVLQWVPDHATLLPRLFGWLAPGGVLSVQMPDNLGEPSHRSMREVAADPRWSAKCSGAAVARDALPSLTAYYDLLCRDGASVDVWRTTYQHAMASPKAIVDWVSSTGLRPFLEPLDSEERGQFLSVYEEKLDRAYPPRADGQRLLAFPRMFLVAKAPADEQPALNLSRS